MALKNAFLMPSNINEVKKNTTLHHSTCTCCTCNSFQDATGNTHFFILAFFPLEARWRFQLTLVIAHCPLLSSSNIFFLSETLVWISMALGKKAVHLYFRSFTILCVFHSNWSTNMATMICEWLTLFKFLSVRIEISEIYLACYPWEWDQGQVNDLLTLTVTLLLYMYH